MLFTVHNSALIEYFFRGFLEVEKLTSFDPTPCGETQNYRAGARQKCMDVSGEFWGEGSFGVRGMKGQRMGGEPGRGGGGGTC